MGLATFRGGIHPPERKELSREASLSPVKPPKTVVIPMSQHIGAPCKPLVEIGEEVKLGQPVGEAGGFVSAPVHASVSGKVVGIGEFPTAMGRMVPCVVIENDMQDTWTELQDGSRRR
jgi:electron transport complex protein RnfC